MELRGARRADAVDFGFADDPEQDGRDDYGLENQGFKGYESELGGRDGVQPQQGDGEQQPPLQHHDGREVAEPLGDGEVDERNDVEDYERENHASPMLSCSR